MKLGRLAGFQKIIFILVFSVLLQTYSFSQLSPGGPFGGSGPSGGTDPGVEGDPGDPGDPGQDPDLPLDSNVFFLVAAGVGYGLKKSWDFKQKIKRDKLVSA